MSFYVLERATGKEVLVTDDKASEYRDSVKYIRLDKPVEEKPKRTVKAAPKRTVKAKAKK